MLLIQHSMHKSSFRAQTQTNITKLATTKAKFSTITPRVTHPKSCTGPWINRCSDVVLPALANRATFNGGHLRFKVVVGSGEAVEVKNKL